MEGRGCATGEVLGFSAGAAAKEATEREGVMRTSKQKMGLGRGSAGCGKPQKHMLDVRVYPHEGCGEPAGVVPAAG